LAGITKVYGSVQLDLVGKQSYSINILPVKCEMLESENQAIAKLQKGQTVTLVGTGDGMTSSLYVGLKDCSVKR
jgi:diphthamide biosynthesis methyltransferase